MLILPISGSKESHLSTTKSVQAFTDPFILLEAKNTKDFLGDRGKIKDSR